MEQCSFLTFQPAPSYARQFIFRLRLETVLFTDTMHSHRLGTDEQVLCIKVLDLEISEITRERRLLAVVGTAIVQGEDLSPKGCIYIFDIVTVVPEPDRPETNRKLKLVVREEVKGAVTAVSSIGTQGFLLMAQGQKCMVRGLKEDGSLLPVAFMDTQCYVTVAKELKGSRMLVLGDIAKGIWFAGYTVSGNPHHRFGTRCPSC